ncbi:MAG: DUF3014 domain-containing protein [Betaproteobacteria bacterium]|nr:DUF3014 domain-containing protein [Betaproteobacteria bacterium]
MKDPVRWMIAAVIVVALGGSLYFWLRRAEEAPQPPPAVPKAPAPEPEAKSAPQIRYPVVQAGDASALPAFADSDAAMREALGSVFGLKRMQEMFNLQDVVRRVVATVDNLPREKVAPRLMPVKPVPGRFVLTGNEENLASSAKNSARYLPAVRMIESVDAGKLVAIYVRYYAWFQQAYKELGYPSGYFNDRLIQVIDHLLIAPELKRPIKLAQRKVLYEFADPQLEARSAGQKMMMRIGAENSARVKAKLREIRREVTGQLPKT